MKRKREHILTKTQIVSAIVLVLIMVGVNIAAHFWPHGETIVEDEEIEDEVYTPQPTRLLAFDPNTADSLTLIELGLRPWQIKNMMKYRAKGGRYKQPEDFRKLYGLTDSAFAALRPYIRIDSTAWVARRDSLRLLKHERDSLKHVADSIWKDSMYTARRFHIKKDTIIELNSADTTDLLYIWGIGSYVAKSIIWYRQDLGGYTSPEQIREIPALKGLGVQFDTIIPHLTAERDSVTRLRVNYIGVERLQRHPYLNFTQAKAIYELRRNKFYLKSIDELRELPCLTEEDIRRLEPYLSFEK
ncbi:MAG: helix-hairpin-helix domain-containing protein [Paludibacteraceae bacterium]|nr:helix-hairpin-helix domain-containing protein [Paludibacteraceae bacterium]MBR6507981.1 helix-hairpin-helix domain-containing protein [Paludibacteraceae bacterium]